MFKRALAYAVVFGGLAASASLQAHHSTAGVYDPGKEVTVKGALTKLQFVNPHGSIVVPTHGGQRGNPVVLDWASAEATLRRGADYGCRHFLDDNPERVYSWAAPTDHFVRDVDLPADYQALLGRASA